MAKFTVSYTQYHRVDRTYIEEIDTTSVEQWNNLIERASATIHDVDISEFPKEPPKDVNVWLRVFKLISLSDFAHGPHDYWASQRSRDFDYQWLVTDEYNRAVAEESSLD
jgi:hypothetical protein